MYIYAYKYIYASVFSIYISVLNVLHKDSKLKQSEFLRQNMPEIKTMKPPNPCSAEIRVKKYRKQSAKVSESICVIHIEHVISVKQHELNISPSHLSNRRTVKRSH